MRLDRSYLGQTMLSFSLIGLLAITACTESIPLPSTNTPGAEAPAQATATSLPPLGAEDSQAIVVNAPTLMPDNEAVIDTV
ncbi:MAG TPA: hypothetical protein VEC93_22400, partial [Anaerolineae bacterium]|nr:hypothetical protein [Anaerolineae bacterium]